MSEPSNGRIEAVLRATERWQKELVDTSGRNRLRRYRDLKTGSLDLTPSRASSLKVQALDRLLGEKPISLSNLIPRAATETDESTLRFEDARRRLAAIHKTALVNFEEKGIETLFAAIGLATWHVETGTAPNAPVILLPLHVESTGAAARDFTIQVAGDAHLNPVLTHILRTEHDIETDDEEADVAENPPMDFDGFRILLDRLQKSWSVLPDLTVEPRVVAANFSYSTMPLVADLEQNGELFAESDIVAAIAGDAGAREALRSLICDPDPRQPNIDPPSDEFLVLDADSSQHMAINRVLGGESLVVQGPPGTGKSQTIANLITALIARGKRVLFVAEKRAAIEAVAKRLHHVGLDDLVMDMHGGLASRRDFARTLAESLKRVSETPAHDYSALHRRLESRRGTLVDNDSALHERRPPWQISVFEMRERLLAIPESAHTQLRLTSKAAREINNDLFDRLAGEIQEWVDLGGHTLSAIHPEWFHSTVSTNKDARESFRAARDILNVILPEARNDLMAALNGLGVTLPDTIAEWRRTVDFFIISNKSRLARMKARAFSREYRIASRAFANSSSISFAPNQLTRLDSSAGALVEGLNALAMVTGLNDLDKMPHGELSSKLERMASDSSIVARLPRIRELEASFQEAEIISVIGCVGDEVPLEHAVHATEYAWLSCILEDLEFEDQRISAFDSGTHSRFCYEFAEADRAHRDSTPQRVHRLTAEAIVATMNQYPDETMLIRREAAKKRRHLSARQLFARASHVLLALRPCWTMSPIRAAEMIPADRQLFDVVIFDEASQIPPAEAIGSLARARQAVIAGDSRQLPPTSFFGRNSVDDNDNDDDQMMLTDDIESLLDTAETFLGYNMLQWHYRSRDDRLIAFSNSHIYGGSLTAFPGVMLDAPVTHCLIPFRSITSATGTRSNPDEVQKVIELVLEHAHETPHETLGVIAFGQHHANNIENALMRRLGEIDDSSLDDFFSERNEERFFVKNIERVQGDERDAIILSVGYHKDVNGNLPYRFGPILQEGGERRLNVAVTRARSHLTLVSSFSHRDMDPGRSSAKGVVLLRQYLEYAASGGANLGADVLDVPLNAFELSIKDGLERRGIPVTPQYGVSGYCIDFACAHSDEPGKMVLAVEADGASYHSANTARDRDRLRQQVLESKGWRFHRIWSTAWFRDREAELDKAEEAWKRAVEASGKDEQPLAQASSAPVVSTSIKPMTPKRGPRPSIPRKGMYGYNSITDYSYSQLVILVEWIESDTLLRTVDELILELMKELGFKRSGKRIRAALLEAIRRARR